MITPSIFTDIINSYLPEPHASLLNGIIFGVNLKTSKLFYEQLKIVGLLHLVVLSGINITMLAAIIANITGFLGKRTSILLTILTIIMFVFFVGPQAPIVRAGITGMLTLVAVLYGRKNIGLYSLFISLIFISIFFPKWLASVSLYLSYGATLGIMLFGQGFSKNQIIKDLRISLAAQIFTVPIIFIYFKQISFISPLSNLIVAPAIPPLMIFGFLTAILGKINYYFGLPFSYICFGLLSYIITVIEKLSSLPYIFINFQK